LKKGIKNPSMATTPHEPNQRLKPAQAATRHRGIAINAQGVRKPIIRTSCLGEFEWPQVGEFEVAIRAPDPVASSGAVQGLKVEAFTP
jgi:hypothetical protein